MKRIALPVVPLAVAATVVACSAAGAGGSGPYRVSAVFDSARGVLVGGLVKIDGANVGTVRHLSITPGSKALVQMNVDRRFVPFRQDATCDIRSSGLVGERFVECNPGSPAKSAAQPGSSAYVSLAHTSVPVDLSDFFDIWNAPVRQRLTLLLNELGITTSGRGEDINALLRRANPALARADAVLAILDRQRAQLADLVSQTNTALKVVAQRGPAVSELIRQGAETFAQIGSSSSALQSGISGLPSLLRRTRTSVRQLNAFATAAIPVLQDFQAAAPQLTRLVSAVPPFAKVALPAVTQLGPALAVTQKTLSDSGAIVRQLASFSRFALPAGQLLDELLVDARQAGAFDYFNQASYFLASATSRYDAFTHLVPAAMLTFANCSGYATTPAGGECQATYTVPSAPGAAARAGHRLKARGRSAPAAVPGPAPAASPTVPAPAPAGAATPPPSSLPAVPGQAAGTAKQLVPLLSYLLGP